MVVLLSRSRPNYPEPPPNLVQAVPLYHTGIVNVPPPVSVVAVVASVTVASSFSTVVGCVAM
jgi:hypothetical protein